MQLLFQSHRHCPPRQCISCSSCTLHAGTGDNTVGSVSWSLWKGAGYKSFLLVLSNQTPRVKLTDIISLALDRVNHGPPKTEFVWWIEQEGSLLLVVHLWKQEGSRFVGYRSFHFEGLKTFTYRLWANRKVFSFWCAHKGPNRRKCHLRHFYRVHLTADWAFF